MQNLTKKISVGGINTDDHLTSVFPPYPDGDYLDSENTRFSSIDGFNNTRISVKGNIEKVNPFLPITGTNYTVGRYESRDLNSLFIFNRNSEGTHGIYQYLPVTDTWKELVVGSALGFNKDWKIHSVDLVNNDLLYWTDARENPDTKEIEGNGMRCLSVSKAVNRVRSYDIVFEESQIMDPAVTTTLITVTLFDETGASIFVGFAYPTGSTYQEWLQSLATGLNAVYTLIEFEACENELTANIVNEGKYTITVTGIVYQGASLAAAEVLAIPANFYPDELRVEHIDRAKYSPLCPPRFRYKNDPEQKQNFLSRKYFQFAIQYEYDNNEISPISPVSELAYGNPLCGIASSEDTSNVIELDFTDSRLNDPISLAVLKRVNILVRFGYTGEWRLVKIMERGDFPISANTFDFYNDGNYAVATEVEYRQVIPLKAIGQSFVQNRGYIAATLEGEDNLDCLDVSTELTYAEACEPEEFGTVYAKIKIRNPGVPGNSVAIWSTGTDIYYGNTPGDDAGAAALLQQLPLAGFLMYAAGTPYAAVSRQIEIGGIPLIPGEENVYDASSPGNIALINAAAGADIIYSEVELSLPPGRHILRIASNQLSEEGTGLYKYPGSGYSRTSALIKGFPTNAETSYSGVCEYIIDVVAATTTDIGTIEIYDFDGYSVLQGYCLDAEDSTDVEDIINGATVEGMAVTDGVLTINSFGNLGATDHNGFFFMAKAAPFVGSWNPVFTNGVVFRTTSQNFFRNDLSDLVNGDAAVNDTLVAIAAGATATVFYNINTPLTFSENTRTRIDGLVVDTLGNPVPGMTILCSLTGRTFTTDGDGRYLGTVYINTLLGAGQRLAYEIVKPSAACCIEFIGPVPDEDYSISSIVGIGTTYTFTNVFTPLDFVLDITELAIDLAWKKRNRVELGIVYLDEAGRRTAVQESSNFITEIPAITDVNGNVGKPQIKFNINHQPPLSAVKYMPVRKVNPYYNRYLQFIIGDVQYVTIFDDATGEPVTTSYGAGDAKEVYMSLIPIINYQQENTGSIISYIPEAGDRVCFLKDDEGNVFSDYYDLEITGRGENTAASPIEVIIKAQTSLPEIFPGTFVELYTPKKVLEQDFYYEFGACYDILDPGTADRRHGAGVDGVDQVLGVSASPATGWLYKGDTFVRTREMFYLDGVEKNYFIRKVEDEYVYDNDINSKQQNIGHPNIADPQTGQFFNIGRIRASDVFNVVANKFFNGLSRFNFGEYVDADRTWGAIQKLVRVGEKHELLAIQSNKIQPVYIGSIPIETLNSGDGRTAISDRLMNLYQPFKSPYGTQHPESIVQDGNQVWGFDMSRATFWYYALNDPSNISEGKKIKTTVQNIVQALELVPQPGVHIWGAIDRQNKEVVWAFQQVLDVEEGPGVGDVGVGEVVDEVEAAAMGEVGVEGVGEVVVADAEAGVASGGSPRARTGDATDEPAVFDPVTLSYSYKRDAWETRYTYFPETMSPVGEMRYFSMKDGKLYQHDQGDAGTWYGVKSPARITLPITVNANLVKNWYGGRIKSIGAWAMSDIQIPANNTFKIGMKSRVSTNNYSLEEGDYWFSFLNDMNTPGFASEIQALFRGRSLKGTILIITFENNDVTQATLEEVAIKFSLSQETV